jgi:hypothetical protein
VTARCSGQAVIGLEPAQRVCQTWATNNPTGPGEVPYLQGFPERRELFPDAPKIQQDMAACRNANGTTPAGAFPELIVNSTGVHVGPPGGPHTQVRSVPALRPFRLETGPANRFVGFGRGGANGQTNYYCFSRVRIAADTAMVSPAAPDHPTGTDIPTTTAGWTPRADMANPDDAVVMYVTGRVEIETGQRLNCVDCARPYPTNVTQSPPPRAGGLQIYLGRRTAADPVPGFNVGNDARFGGAIHGPEAVCGGSGGLSTAGTSADIFGALVCNTIDGVGQWHFHYDESLEFLGNAVFTGLRWDER